MKWTDPSIKLVASAVSNWDGQTVERTQLLLEQAGNLIDYLSLHWYVGNWDNNFAELMAVSEIIEERLSAVEGLIRMLRLENRLTNPISIAVDEWNVWYRTRTKESGGPSFNKLEEHYNLEDALVAAMHFNAFIRHADTVKMANIAQIVNVIAPVFTSKDDLFLQTIFYPFEIYSSTCGQTALDIWQSGETFSGGKYHHVPMLDVSATLDSTGKQLAVYVVNRSPDKVMETQIELTSGKFSGQAKVLTVNGPDIKSENTFTHKETVKTRKHSVAVDAKTMTYEFAPHSVTAVICKIV
jgi:alpha-N-arabinofuranosidase